jgi:hypothetical protein
VAELGLPVEVLDHLPCQELEDNLSVKSLLSIENWQTILQNAHDRTSDMRGLLAAIDSGIRVALREAGLDLGTVNGPHIAEMLQLLAEAPASIRDCDFLTVEERYAMFSVSVDGVSDEYVQAAQHATLELFENERVNEPGSVRDSCAPRNSSVTEVFEIALDKIQRQATRAEEDELFTDDAELREGIIKHLAASPSVSDAVVDGRPTADVLNERLRNLERPEFHLIARLVISVDEVDEACRRWLLALKGDAEPEGPRSQVATG